MYTDERATNILIGFYHRQ